MDAKKSKLASTEDETTKLAFQKYNLLKQAVDIWQQERSSHWLEMLGLAEKPPYLPIMDLPSEAIIELWQRLNIVAKLEISDSDLREMWEQFKQSQDEMDAEMSARLQMAVSGVVQLAGKMANEQNDSHDSMVCPVCGEVVTLAVLTPPNGKRIMHCNLCGFEWTVKRVGCLQCGSEDAKQQIFLKNEAFPGIEIVVCQHCRQYIKEIDARELSAQDYMWEDLRTLPLNFAAENWLAELTKKNDQLH